jgi:hypothetical protein
MQGDSSARKRSHPEPRKRRCLLKGCDQRFHPRQARQRYCSDECRAAARRWSRWKAQERYRTTPAGQEKRSDQSRRYRERVKSRKPPEPEPVSDLARVITKEDFFRPFLRPAGLLRALRAAATKSFAALLFARVPASTGAGPGKRTPLESIADLKLEILIHRRTWPYIQPV